MQDVVSMTYDCSMSPGWHNVIRTVSNPDELAPGRISSYYNTSNVICLPDHIPYHLMSSEWHPKFVSHLDGLRRVDYVIRMACAPSLKSYGWNSKHCTFSQLAVALQCFHNFQAFYLNRMTYGQYHHDDLRCYPKSSGWHDETWTPCHRGNLYRVHFKSSELCMAIVSPWSK